MKAFCITLTNLQHSVKQSRRCIDTGILYGIQVNLFNAVDKYNSTSIMEKNGVNFSWYDPKFSSKDPVIGCFMSHFLLWKICLNLNEEILVLEHDAVFKRELPSENYVGILNIGKPSWILGLDDIIYEMWPEGVAEHPFEQFRGAYGYLIKPWAAKSLIDTAKEKGVCPVDEFINKQYFPWLQIYKPFVVYHDSNITTIQKNNNWVKGGITEAMAWELNNMN